MPSTLRGCAARARSATTRPTSRATDRSPTPSCSTGCEAAAAATSARASGPGDRVVLWAPNSIDWAVAALAVVLRRRRAGAGQLPLHRPRGGRHRRPHPRRAGRGRTTASSAATQVAELPDAGALPRCRRILADSLGTVDASDAADVDDAGRRGRPRRRRRHPVHLRHDRALQGRDERAPPDHRRRAGLGRARRGRQRGPLPGGQPVLPLLRLQDRHRRRAAHRRARSTRWRRSTSTRRCG